MPLHHLLPHPRHSIVLAAIVPPKCFEGNRDVSLRAAATRLRVRRNRGAKLKTPKDPNAPKRPPSSYVLFCVQERKKLSEANPEITGRAVTDELGRRWGLLTDDQKKPFKDEAAKLTAEYVAAVEMYKSAGGVPGGVVVGSGSVAALTAFERAVQTRAGVDEAIAEEQEGGEIQVGSRVSCRYGEGILLDRLVEGAKCRVEMEHMVVSFAHPGKGGGGARIRRAVASLHTGRRAQRSDTVPLSVQNDIDSSTQSRCPTSPCAKDEVRLWLGPGQWTTARRMFRFVSFDTLWQYFRKDCPASAGWFKHGDKEGHPVQWRKMLPWQLGAEGGDSCLCQTCEDFGLWLKAARHTASLLTDALLSVDKDGGDGGGEEGEEEEEGEEGEGGEDGEGGAANGNEHNGDGEEEKERGGGDAAVCDADAGKGGGAAAAEEAEDETSALITLVTKLVGTMGLERRRDVCLAITCGTKGVDGDMDDRLSACVNGDCERCGFGAIWGEIREKIMKSGGEGGEGNDEGMGEGRGEGKDEGGDGGGDGGGGGGGGEEGGRGNGDGSGEDDGLPDGAAQCDKGHRLVQSVTTKRMGCDGCSKEFKAGSTLYGCTKCDFDLCSVCMEEHGWSTGPVECLVDGSNPVWKSLVTFSHYTYRPKGGGEEGSEGKEECKEGEDGDGDYGDKTGLKKELVRLY